MSGNPLALSQCMNYAAKENGHDGERTMTKAKGS